MAQYHFNVFDMRRTSIEGKLDTSKQVPADALQVGERNVEDQYDGESTRWRPLKSRSRMLVDAQVNLVDDGETSTKWGDSQRKNQRRMVNLKVDIKPFPSRKSSTVEFSKNGKGGNENQGTMFSKFNTDLNDIVTNTNSPNDHQIYASPNGKQSYFPETFSTFSGSARRQTF